MDRLEELLLKMMERFEKQGAEVELLKARLDTIEKQNDVGDLMGVLYTIMAFKMSDLVSDADDLHAKREKEIKKMKKALGNKRPYLWKPDLTDEADVKIVTGKHGNDPIYPVHDQFCQTLAKMGIAIADFKCADDVRKIRNATDHCTPLLKGNIQANLIGFTAGYMRRKTEMEYDAAFLNIIKAVSENTKNLTF